MEEDISKLTLEERGAKAGEEIQKVLGKYDLALSVDISGAKEFIQTLTPTLIDARKKEDSSKDE